MPKLTDTFKLAFDCCDEVLRDTGKFPTIDAVRSRIGVNSPNTIKNAINQWTEHFAKRHLEKLNRPTVPIALLDALEKVWYLAVKDAEQAYQTKELAMKEMEERFKALEMERAVQLADSQALHEKDAFTHAATESQRTKEQELQIALAKVKLDHLKSLLQAAKEAKLQVEHENVHLRKTQSNLQKQVETITKVMEDQRNQLEEREHTIKGLNETLARLKLSVGSQTTKRIRPKQGE